MDLENADKNEQNLTEKYFKKYLLDSETNGEAYGEYIVKLTKFYL